MSETVSDKNFELSHRRDIDIEHIRSIRESVGWDPDIADVWQRTLETALDVTTAWDGDNMVGVGFLVGSPRHAVLCDIAVSPTHQKQGIGRAVVEELINAAQEQQIKYVTLTFAEDRPWLKDFYGSLGFRSIDDAMQLGEVN
jgi:GNAT superfamily N-acetyltransferase